MTTPPPAPLVAGDDPIRLVYGDRNGDRGYPILVYLRGYAPITPDQLLARLSAADSLSAALGEARADAAALRVQVAELQQQLAVADGDTRRMMEYMMEYWQRRDRAAEERIAVLEQAIGVARRAELIAELHRRQEIDQQDLAGLQADYDRIYRELAALKARLPCLEAAAGVSDEH